MYSSSPFILSVFLLLFSIPILFFLAPHILPPKTLPSIPDPDEADDLALFRRATLSTTTTSSSSSSRRHPPIPPSPPKIAFLFLSNSDLFFAPLWEKFFSGSSPPSRSHNPKKKQLLFNIYIHLDPAARINQSLLTPSFKNRFIPSKPTQRASPTLISAARRLLAASLLDDPSNAFFALISQTCIPLHSFAFVYHSIFYGGGSGGGQNRNNQRRHGSFIEILDKEPTLWDRYVARGDNVMLPEVPFEKFRVGSQFFVLARRHAVLVVRDRRLWNKFKMPCLRARKDSCYPEEHYFPTLLSMEDPKGCTHYTLTRVNWTGSVGGHPHTYSSAEVSGELIRELRKSNSSEYEYLFARKFAKEALEPLLKIVDKVILKD